MSELQKRFDELTTSYAAIKAKFQEDAQKIFHETFKEFFALNPGVTAVKWAQYTPYFNDGEACVFGVGDVTFTNAPKEELENISAWGEYDGEDETVWAVSNIKYTMTADSAYYKEDQEKIKAAGGVDVESCSALERMIGSDVMEDVLLAMFDDHATVVATRDGFDVEEYEHD